MPEVSAFLTLGRFAVLTYASLATALTTACLVLHMMLALERRARRHRQGARGRPLFLRLDAEPAPSVD
jgi:hypothetical protein